MFLFLELKTEGTEAERLGLLPPPQLACTALRPASRVTFVKGRVCEREIQ
jgi:hypothetical protein